LLFAFKRFETFLEPLLEASPHSEMADSLENANKVFESSMTLLVKSAVIEKLIHSILFSTLDESFE
jgi:hypothetical protein